MPDAALTALGLLLEPARLAALFAGVLMGLALGVIPGLGGIVGLTLLLPFTTTLDPYTAFALLLGMAAVTTTSDTIPAVLFGVPGTTGSAATVLDGHPMAERGEAGRAFGAAFSASLVGGVFGALVLALAIPVMRPVILLIGSPELLAISILGLSMVAALSGRAPLRGLTMACLGLLLSMVGADPINGTPRWTSGSLYLLDGLELVPLTLGLFALPEIADMAVARRSIGGGAGTHARAGQWQGVRDMVRHKWLVLRSAAIGAGLGALPGFGSAVIDWIAYGHAARTERGAQATFGTGDVRGVLAPEGANNAKEGGALIPTIAFGVPGSASMAILLGAFLVHGLQPGPRMLSDSIGVTYAMVWSISLANILGAGACFALSNQFARIATIRPPILVPLVLAVILIGAYQGSRQWGDLIVLFSFGLLGWVMKRLDWPRSPLILGFVLGPMIERYLFISTARYGGEWLLRPIVVVVLAVAVIGVLLPLVRESRGRRRDARAPLRTRASPPLCAGTMFHVAIIVAIATMFVSTTDWSDDAERLAPATILAVAGLSAVASLVFDTFRAPQAEMRARRRANAVYTIDEELAALPRRTIALRSLILFGWIALTLLLIWLAGFLPATFVLIAMYIRVEGRERWLRALALASLTTLAFYVLFDQLLSMVWPRSLIGQAVPVALETIASFLRNH